MRFRFHAALSLAALLVSIACGGSSSGGGSSDETAPQAPVLALLAVHSNPPPTADQVSGDAGAVEGGARVVARADSASGAEIGRVTAAADGSFAAISLGDNAHATIALVAVDAAGNASDATVVTNDVVAPDASFVTTPAESGYGPFHFELASDDPGAAFRCAIDGGAEGACGAAHDVAPLPPGPHTLSVVAVDAAGNRDPTPATFSWREVWWGDVSLGMFRTACALDTDSRLFCWGGTLTTIGTVPPSPDPALVGTGYESVSAGARHACAVRSDGTLHCMGSNDHKQLGMADVWFAFEPMQVGTATDWQWVGAGQLSTCARNADDRLFCWGAAYSGILGDGSTLDREVPGEVTVASGTRWTDVALRDFHACGVRDSGTLWCWGVNNSGQLGGTSIDNMPVQVIGTDWAAVDVGSSQSCGVKVDGSRHCWGYVVSGVYSPTPVPFGPEGWVGVTFGEGFGCGWDATGEATCGGDNDRGQLGTGTPSQVPDTFVPVAAGPFSKLSSSASSGTTCGVTTAGELTCWGTNEFGTLANGTVGLKTAPAQVAPALVFTELTAGNDFTCALSGGKRYCFGGAYYYQNGLPTRLPAQAPATVDAASEWSSVAGSFQHACALDSSADLRCWGLNTDRQLGSDQVSVSPAPLTVAGPWTRAIAGGRSSCGLRAGTSALECWGANDAGQLGRGSKTFPGTPTPAPVSGGGAWSTAALGYDYACGVKAGGTLHCWGANAWGQLGTGDDEERLDPTPIGTSTGWTAVSAGTMHACGVDAGVLKCWGYNNAGQLGIGSGASSQTPQPVALSATFETVSAGEMHTCAISSGRLYCFGNNSRGQAGTGTFIPPNAPARVGTDSDWIAVAVGGTHACGLREGGSLWCWGSNERGQLGDGTAWSATPQAVPLP
jgi:alpha-tubulin suppressor-like RCC1 family protein